MVRNICLVGGASRHLRYGDAAKKKKQTTSLESASNAISKYLNNVTEFLGDIMDMFSDFVGTSSKNNKKKKKTGWGLTNMWRFANKNIKNGFKIIDDTISIMKMARSTIDDVSPILPDVTLAKFIETLLYHVVPELMKKNPQIWSNSTNTTEISGNVTEA
ncbi:uncharacterized protein LOC126264637 isoform X2 [Aethina tumida]|uniref:uncharacterized protein LOC126264637 isoform X2 n=1 Tax=Aethina tumida TaxID=116153 RepID=UPI0021497DF1|nr:uncharacterized protein LOC126264637 isoform X2 [Aethina tumida]